MLHRYFKVFDRVSHLRYSLVLAGAVLSATQFTHAQTTVDQLSDCLVKSTTATDKTTVLQWTYAALSAHPDLKAFSQVTPQQKDQLDQKLAQVLQRIIVDQCSAQTKAVIQTDGLEAVGQSFQQLGREAGESIIKDPAVSQQLQGTLRYIDLNKIAMTFLTPNLLNKIGL